MDLVLKYAEWFIVYKYPTNWVIETVFEVNDLSRMLFASFLLSSVLNKIYKILSSAGNMYT